LPFVAVVIVVSHGVGELLDLDPINFRAPREDGGEREVAVQHVHDHHLRHAVDVVCDGVHASD
jgi:hypothetical protein